MKRAKLVKYEQDFVSKCNELKLPIKYAEDDCPYVSAKGRFRKVVKIYPWGKNEFGVVIMAEHGKTLNTIIKKIAKVIPEENRREMLLDEEGIVIIIKLENIKKLIRPLSLRERKVLSEEHKAKLLAGLAKRRKKDQTN